MTSPITPDEYARAEAIFAKVDLVETVPDAVALIAAAIRDAENEAYKRERIQTAVLEQIRLRDWAWAGGGRDNRVQGTYGAMAAHALGKPGGLPDGWPSENEGAELLLAARALKSPLPKEP